MSKGKKSVRNRKKSRKKQICIPYPVLLVVCALIIFMVSLCHIGEIYQLYVLHDEFGYWLNAAHFAGYDWSGIASISPYYSYGYSILLAPLFWIFHDSVLMYRAAIVLNALLYVGSFMLSVMCAEKLFPTVRKSMLTAVCLVAALYCNNQLQANMAWTEALLYFWFWLLVFTLLMFLDKQKLVFVICFALELVYLYIIHQRTLGVVIAGFGTLVFIMLLRYKRNWKKIFTVAGVLCAGFLLVALLKGYLQNNLWMWENQEIAGQNDYAGQLWKLQYIFTTKEGMVQLLTGFMGKVLYLLISSGGLLFWAVCYGKELLFQKQTERKNYVAVFVGLSLLFTLGISSVMMINGGRIDCVVYGRYSEFLIGPLLLFGLLYLYEKKPQFIQYALFLLLFLMCGLGTKEALKTRETFTYIQSVASGIFYDAGTGEILFQQYMIFGLLLATIIFLIGRWKKKLITGLAIITLIGYWGLSAQTALAAEVLSGQRNIKNVSHITDLVEQVEEDCPIYFVQDHDAGFFNWRIENIQFLLRERRIELVTYEELPALSGNYYLTQYGIDDLDMSRYEVVSQAYGMVLMVPKDTELFAKCLVYNGEHPYTFSETMMYSETQAQEFGYDSDYKEGFLVFCQDLTLSPGRYRVEMDLNVEGYPSYSVLGNCDVSYEYGQAILYSRELSSAEVDGDGKVHVVYEFDCQETVRHAEMRFYSYGNAKIELEELSYTRIE